MDLASNVFAEGLTLSIASTTPSCLATALRSSMPSMNMKFEKKFDNKRHLVAKEPGGIHYKTIVPWMVVSKLMGVPNPFPWPWDFCFKKITVSGKYGFETPIYMLLSLTQVWEVQLTYSKRVSTCHASDHHSSFSQEGPGRFKGSKAPYEGQAVAMLGTWIPRVNLPVPWCLFGVVSILWAHVI